MSPEKQRIAIAEACGWTSIDSAFVGYWPGAEDPMDYDTVPDYLNDLNAVHEAIRTLTEGQLVKFTKTLAMLVRRAHEERAWTWSNEMLVASATAAEWSEAFLVALGKWEDSK